MDETREQLQEQIAAAKRQVECEGDADEILGEYLEQQRTGALSYSRYGRQKANIRTLQGATSAWAYLDEQNIGTSQDLEDRI